MSCPGGGKPLSIGKRSKAVQAFWAMHVEALNWSGLSATNYATALDMSAHSLRRWRDLFDAEAMSIDWRSRLHPSARPPIGTGASTDAKESVVDRRLTSALTAEALGDRRSATSATSRNPSMIFRWRVQFGFGKEKAATLETVTVAGKEGKGGVKGSALVLHDLLPIPGGMAAVDLPDGRRVFAPAGADPESVRWHVAELQANGREFSVTVFAGVSNVYRTSIDRKRP